MGDTFTVNVVKFTPTVGLPSPPSPDDTEGEEDEVTDTEGERDGESVEEGEKVVRSDALGEKLLVGEAVLEEVVRGLLEPEAEEVEDLDGQAERVKYREAEYDGVRVPLPPETVGQTERVKGIEVGMAVGDTVIFFTVSVCVSEEEGVVEREKEGEVV